MRKNSLALGEKHFEGDYNRILSAGELDMNNSDIKKCYAVGELKIKNSKIKKIRFAGEIDAHETTFEDFKVAGEVRMSGICKADIVIVTGELSAENLECRLLRENKVKDGDFNGKIDWYGYFKAETFENFHDLSLTFEYNFKNLISSGLLTSENEIICENFYGFSGVSAPMINAENITLLSNANTKIESLTGSNITVKKAFNPDKLFKSIPKTVIYGSQTTDGNIAVIHQIEGDNIFIEYTKSNYISGNNVVIGDLCIVQRVEYKNSVKISEKAVVNEVIKV